MLEIIEPLDNLFSFWSILISFAQCKKKWKLKRKLIRGRTTHLQINCICIYFIFLYFFIYKLFTIHFILILTISNHIKKVLVIWIIIHIAYKIISFNWNIKIWKKKQKRQNIVWVSRSSETILIYLLSYLVLLRIEQTLIHIWHDWYTTITRGAYNKSSIFD